MLSISSLVFTPELPLTSSRQVFDQSSLYCFLTIMLLVQGPTVTADTVIGRDGFLLGAEASYNVTEGKISHYSAATGYNAPEYAVTLHALSNLRNFHASYYHRVSPDVEAGAKAVYDTKATAPSVALEVGAKA
jgi:voltage-dependent anion channel protein 2